MFFKNKNKRAFTMVELLVTMVCLGLLTIGFAAYASAINNHAETLKQVESDMLSEYQDVLSWRSPDLVDVNTLNFSEYLKIPSKHALGSQFLASDEIRLTSIQKAEYKSLDPTIVSVSETGACDAVGVGITCIEIRIATMNESGDYVYDSDYTIRIPVVVYNIDDAGIFFEVAYMYYNGKYFNCWICN